MKHKHHIIPKHMGGTDDPSNLVELTIEEHAEAHKILWEKYGKKEDELAWKGLIGLMSKKELIKELMFLGRQKGGFNGKGKTRVPLTIEHKNKIKNSCKGKNLGKSGMAKTYSGFVDPNGNRVVIKNLYDFCKHNNLNQGTMSYVALGKFKQHKGWTYLRIETEQE